MQHSHVPTRITLEDCPAGYLGLGTATPSLSWNVADAPAGWVQTKAEVELVRSGRTQAVRLEGSQQVAISWPFAPLSSRESVTVRVRVEGAGGWSDWSEPALFEVGLLEPSDWVAQMVGPAEETLQGELRRPSLVRSDFVTPGRVTKARLYVTAHGLIEPEINGERVGADELVPGWTVYEERLPYRVYDVSALIRQGQNAIGAWLADGWYRGRIGFDGGVQDFHGTDIGAMMQLELTDSEGTVTAVATGQDWTAGPSPIVTSGLYEGETYDAREYPHGWSEPGFEDDSFKPVKVGRREPQTLYTPNVPPVRCTAEIQPRTIEPIEDGKYLLDFGQNASGRLRVTVDAPEGATITIRHAEVIEEAELGTRPLRRAWSEDRYVSAGTGPVQWEPRFTIHGFRYAEIEGWPEDQKLDVTDAVFRVLQTDVPRTGWFACSNPRVTKLHENIVWSTRSNFVSIPTDCPQRDERLGWTGDLQIFASTALYLYQLGPMISDWLRDVEIEQIRRGGAVPVYAPKIPGHFWDDQNSIAVWGDVTVLAPWRIYQATGNRRQLEERLSSATGWVEHIQGLVGPSGVWDEGMQLGDWLDPAAPPDNPFDAKTDAHLVASAYLVQSTRTLGKILEVLGKPEAAAIRFEQADKHKAAFQRRYLTDDGTLTSDTQTAYALAITFDLLDGSSKSFAGERLAELVRQAEGRISTGFAGTPLVCKALEITGHNEEAYLLLEQDELPSWLYTVNMGGTTTWERWDSMLPDGTINPGDMTSFNHYALGAVAEWMHTTVGGLRPLDPGYRTIEIAPKPGGSLRWARTAHITPFGLARVQWVLKGGQLRVSGQIPVGTTAVLRLPGCEEEVLGSGEFSREVPVSREFRGVPHK